MVLSLCFFASATLWGADPAKVKPKHVSEILQEIELKEAQKVAQDKAEKEAYYEAKERAYQEAKAAYWNEINNKKI
jgi:hypothetical protein